jgi:hypothetical protein
MNFIVNAQVYNRTGPLNSLLRIERETNSVLL